MDMTCDLEKTKVWLPLFSFWIRPKPSYCIRANNSLTPCYKKNEAQKRQRRPIYVLDHFACALMRRGGHLYNPTFTMNMRCDLVTAAYHLT